MLRIVIRPHVPLVLGLLGISACSGVDSTALGEKPGRDGGSSSSEDEDSGSRGGRDVDGGASDGDQDGGADAGKDAEGGAADPSVNYVPTFPGAPTSQAGKPLTGGKVCDDVPGATIETITNVTRCFYGEDESEPAATIEQVLECVEGTQTLHLRLMFNPNFNDNTYGTGSIGWPRRRGHWFRDLTGSDHAELELVDGDGEIAMQFKLDYIEADPTAPSGYASQCIAGGDGNITVGDAAHVVDCTTSLDENLNARGYGDYTTDSPATDEDYSVNSDAPEWDYRMVFDVWVDTAAFGDAGFAGAFIEYVHASPAKGDEETIIVVSEECPPCVPAPDYVCEELNPPPPEEECMVRPDQVCEEVPPPPAEPPPFCELYPTDPACLVI